MNEPTRDDPALIATPRSTLLRAFLGTASAAATALIYELVRTLVVDSVGDDPRVQSAIETIFWVPVVLLATAAAVYVGFRLTRDLRVRLTAARTSDLIADLVEPGPTVAPGLRVQAEQLPTDGRFDYRTLCEIRAVIANLPIGEYRTAALLTMLGAMLEAPARVPDVREPPQGTATELVAALVPMTVERLSAGQFRRRVGLMGLDDTNPMWRAALPALLRYHADLTERWSIALNSAPTAAGAARWFESEEDYLRALIVSCASSDFVRRLDGLRAAIVPDLVRIADALDAWYAVSGRSENVQPLNGSGGPAVAIRDVTAVDAGTPGAGLGLWWQLARIRTGESVYGARNPNRRRRLRRPWLRTRRYRPHEFATSLLARGEHRAALARLSTSTLEVPPPYPPIPVDGRRAGWSDPPTAAEIRRTGLNEVERELEHAWWRMPRADIAGEVAASLNLAIVHLHQHRLDAAADRLELAESLTADGLDPRGRAHVHETMGVVWWARGETPRALRCWQSALRDYRTMDDTLGIARSLQHLGCAAVVAPEECGALLVGVSSSTTTEVLRQATGWLARAEQLRRTAAARHPTDAIRHAATYRHKAVMALLTAANPVMPLADIEHWPLGDAEA